MATESPLIHDGSQTVAAADYSNTAGKNPSTGTGASSAGSGSAQFYCVVLSQTADRTSVLASALGAQIYGILQNKPKLGDPCDVGLSGISKALVGAAGSTHGKPQMCDANGLVTDWVAGAGSAQIGFALESGAAGAIITLYLFGCPPKVLT